jgi:amphi-Trp domain-containing protein
LKRFHRYSESIIVRQKDNKKQNFFYKNQQSPAERSFGPFDGPSSTPQSCWWPLIFKEDEMAKKKDRDIEKGYSVKQTVAKLRRLADCLESGKKFRIQIAGERIQIPAKAIFNIEHEREGNTEEVEFQFKWEQ